MEKWKNPILLFPVFIICSILALIYINFLNTKKFTIKLEKSDRQYLVHFPPSYKASEKMPVVIALHGYTDNPRFMELYTGLSRKADKEGFIVVYPYGTKSVEDKNLSWNGGSCCGNGVLENVDDVSFINSLTDDLINKYNIDSKRVYVVGFSNGALLAYRLASETPQRYKAFAIVSGSIGGKVYEKLPQFVIKAPGEPVSILIMHGLLDKRIPYKGGLNKGKDGNFKSFSDARDMFMKINKCGDAVISENSNFIEELFSCDESKMELFTVKNTGHVWPGGLLDYKNVLRRKTTPTTNLVWNFFKEVN